MANAFEKGISKEHPNTNKKMFQGFVIAKGFEKLIKELCCRMTNYEQYKDILTKYLITEWKSFYRIENS